MSKTENNRLKITQVKKLKLLREKIIDIEKNINDEKYTTNKLEAMEKTYQRFYDKKRIESKI